MPRERDLVFAIGQLEQRVAAIEAHLGLTPPAPTTDASPEVAELVASGRTIEAIRLHREQTGLGLAEAKDAIERLRDTSRLPGT